MSPAAKGGLLRANVTVALGTGLSRLTGFGRTFALLYALGQTGLTDAYNTANSTPNIVYELMVGGVLTATLVPIFVERLAQRAAANELHDADRRAEHRAAADGAISAIVGTAIWALLALTVLAVALAPVIVGFYGAPKRVDPTLFHGEATRLARFFLPQIFFYGLMSIASALLNAARRFGVPAWTPVLNNIVVIATLLLVPTVVDAKPTLAQAADGTSLTWLLGLGTTAGIAVMTLATLPAVRRLGLHISLRPQPRHPVVRELLRLSGWTVGYVISNQIALFVVSRLALRQGEGGISSYQAAFMFFQLPHGLLAVSLMTTFAPTLVTAVTKGDLHWFRRRLCYGVVVLTTLVAPAALGIVALAPHLIGVLKLGQFTAQDVKRTADVLLPFAAGLVGFSIYLFVLRGFYAFKDTKTPFVINAVENLLNIVLAFPFAARWGVPGLAWAYSVAYAVSAVLALVILQKRTGRLLTPTFVGAVLRPLAAATFMCAVVVRVANRMHGGPLPIVGAGIAIGVVTYPVFLVLVRAVELLTGRPRPPARPARVMPRGE